MNRSRKMLAATIVKPGQVRVAQVPIPSPGPGQVLVRIEGCGVCASNIPPWEGRSWFEYPFEPGQLGHEGWGRVVALGRGVAGLKEGSRVAMLSNNAYAEYDVAGAAQVVPLPPELEHQPFPGEPLGCALNIFARSGIRSGQTVAIVGAGFLGAMLTRLSSQAGARVLAISRRKSSRQIATDLGAQHAIPMDDHWKIIEQVRELTGGDLCDVVIEAVGLEWPLNLAAELTRQRGRLVVAGFHQDGPRQINMQLWNWRGLDVVNAHERQPEMYTAGIRSAIEAVLSGTLDPNPLLTHRYSLDGLGAALNATRDRPENFVKAMVLMQPTSSSAA